LYYIITLVLQWYNSPKKRSSDKHVTHTQSLYYIITLSFRTVVSVSYTTVKLV
jgi:hypothetical protein